MRRSILTVCLVLGITRPARPDAGYDLKREIAWARATWPRDLKTLRFESPTAKLVAWVPPGASIQVWAYSPAHDCAPVELRRVSDPGPRTAGGEPLEGKEIFEQSLRNGAPTRFYQVFWIGDQFTSNGDQLAWEQRDAQGAWQPTGSSGTSSDSEPFGALSHVDATVARFGGTPMALYGRCVGPIRWLACRSGGERPCIGCEKTEIDVVEARDHYSDGGLFSPDRPATCHERCPPESNPALARLDVLQSRIQVWQPSGESRAETPSLHRTLASCMRTHHPKTAPPRARSPMKPRADHR
jgi:hypothetical protein